MQQALPQMQQGALPPKIIMSDRVVEISAMPAPIIELPAPPASAAADASQPLLVATPIAQCASGASGGAAQVAAAPEATGGSRCVLPAPFPPYGVPHRTFLTNRAPLPPRTVS